MAILKVAHMGHPVLRAKAKPLSVADIKHPSLQILIEDMLDTMAEYHGVGLAAPQVHEGVRMFVGVLESAKPDAGKDAPDPEPLVVPVVNVTQKRCHVVETV